MLLLTGMTKRSIIHLLSIGPDLNTKVISLYCVIFYSLNVAYDINLLYLYSFPPPYVKGHSSNKWLLNSFADFWSFWLPMDTFPTIKLYGSIENLKFKLKLVTTF